jgi:hypothetical protein
MGIGAADAVVDDLDVEVAAVDCQFHGGVVGVRVFDDVGQCLGDDEVGRGFQVGR